MLGSRPSWFLCFSSSLLKMAPICLFGHCSQLRCLLRFSSLFLFLTLSNTFASQLCPIALDQDLIWSLPPFQKPWLYWYCLNVAGLIKALSSGRLLCLLCRCALRIPTVSEPPRPASYFWGLSLFLAEASAGLFPHILHRLLPHRAGTESAHTADLCLLTLDGPYPSGDRAFFWHSLFFPLTKPPCVEVFSSPVSLMGDPCVLSIAHFDQALLRKRVSLGKGPGER